MAIYQAVSRRFDAGLCLLSFRSVGNRLPGLPTKAKLGQHEELSLAEVAVLVLVPVPVHSCVSISHLAIACLESVVVCCRYCVDASILHAFI